MRVQCDRCGSSYTLPEARVAPGRRLQFQCRHCQHRIIVQVPAPGDFAEPTATLVAKVLWFISTASGPQQRMDTEGVHSGIGEGSVIADSWLWRKGMAEWARAAEVPEFASSFAVPSPTAAMEPIAVADPNNDVIALTRPAVLSGSHVAGAASVHKGAGFQTDQRAIPMPIIRATSDGAQPNSDDRRPKPAGPRPMARLQQRDPSAGQDRSPQHAGAGRSDSRSEANPDLRPEQRPADKRQVEGRTSAYAAMADDDDAPNDDKGGRGKWSPATDTYTGQRARMTRRVNDRDRQDAVQWANAADRREADLANLQASLKAWQRLALATLAALSLLLLLSGFLALRWRDAADAAKACKGSVPAPAAQSAK